MRTAPRSCSRSPRPGRGMAARRRGRVALQGFDETRWARPAAADGRGARRRHRPPARDLAGRRAHLRSPTRRRSIRSGVGDLDGVERDAGGGSHGPRDAARRTSDCGRWARRRCPTAQVAGPPAAGGGAGGVARRHAPSTRWRCRTAHGSGTWRCSCGHRARLPVDAIAGGRDDGHCRSRSISTWRDRRRPAGRRLDRGADRRPGRALRRRRRHGRP